ncbi:MAG: hypothetical protein SFY32_10710 [Bacteroidota bacterium]|nr:hypothetical protein [Bacteroidota bacterium]
MNSNELFNSIVKSVLEIDNTLKNANNTGIFFAPELYVAFHLGLDITNNKSYIFNDYTTLEWCRETNLGNGGPSDILYKIDSKYNTVIELKIRQDYYSYEADIEKLLKLPSNMNRYFCVLVDSFSNQNDARITKLFEKYEMEKIGSFDFETWNERYVKQVYCIINLFKV